MSSGGFCCSSRPLSENEKIDKYCDLAWELKKAVKHEVDGDTNNSGCSRNSPQGPQKETGKIANQKKTQNHTEHSSVKSN